VTLDVAGRGEVEIDFTPPFRVISIPDRLREAVHPLPLPDLNSHGTPPPIPPRTTTRASLPPPHCVVCVVCVVCVSCVCGVCGVWYVSCGEPDSAPALLEICKQLGVDAPAPHTTARLVDKLIGTCPPPRSAVFLLKGVDRRSNVRGPRAWQQGTSSSRT
jgi:hypothetical protein